MREAQSGHIIAVHPDRTVAIVAAAIEAAVAEERARILPWAEARVQEERQRCTSILLEAVDSIGPVRMPAVSP
jgi:hypothetical protein